MAGGPIAGQRNGSTQWLAKDLLFAFAMFSERGPNQENSKEKGRPNGKVGQR